MVPPPLAVHFEDSPLALESGLGGVAVLGLHEAAVLDSLRGPVASLLGGEAYRTRAPLAAPLLTTPSEPTIESGSPEHDPLGTTGSYLDVP